ncbi:MAG TPA: YdcF family protein, partial [Nitrosospira sp.]
MGWYATNLISAFLLPPFNLILLGTAGLLLLKWRPRLGQLLIAVTLALLYLLSTPFFAELMLQRL